MRRVVKGNGVSYLFIYILEKETLFQKLFLYFFLLLDNSSRKQQVKQDETTDQIQDSCEIPSIAYTLWVGKHTFQVEKKQISSQFEIEGKCER